MFFFFVVVVYHVGLFVYAEPSFWPWSESNSIMVYDPFYVIRLLIFYWGFYHLHSSEVLACSFTFIYFFFQYLSLVLASGWCWFHRITLVVFPLLRPFWRVREDSWKLFFVCSLVKPSTPGLLFVGRFLFCILFDLISLLLIGLFMLSCFLFLLIQFWQPICF